MPAPHIPVDHPGVYLAEELEARGWAQRDLAFVLGVPEQSVHMIVSGKRGITAPMAKSLAEAFDVSADLFLNLQKQYDLSIAASPDAGVSSRARVQQQYPLREMIRRGWIEEAEPKLLEAQVARFFRVSSVDEVPHLRHAAKKTRYDDIPPAQLAWLYRVKQLAAEMIVPPYRQEKLQEAAEVLKALLAAPSDIRHVPRILEECGVRYVVCEALPGAGIDGVCFWLDKASPVIGMTLRYDRIDNFWFVLRHEIEHVLRRDGQREPVIDADLDPTEKDIPAEEQRANKAAADFCVPIKQMDSFYIRKNPFFGRAAILNFAERIKVHPGLVVGQLQFRTKKWNHLRELQVKVRHIITSSALTDGWGEVVPVEA